MRSGSLHVSQRGRMGGMEVKGVTDMELKSRNSRHFGIQRDFRVIFMRSFQRHAL